MVMDTKTAVYRSTVLEYDFTVSILKWSQTPKHLFTYIPVLGTARLVGKYMYFRQILFDLLHVFFVFVFAVPGSTLCPCVPTSEGGVRQFSAEMW